ncbi:hypothetical protein CP532_3549 [Ophiocordyceps camponoti-leonardi (nom. inval.)]|nr:hypothetical protein CP532_3549 [Ophiocordyceps camponoti-leonardi (nom. inval.)]
MCGFTVVIVLLVAAGLTLYGLHVNRLMTQTPPEVLDDLEPPLTPDRARLIYRRVKEHGIDWTANLPPAKDRRYLIVGGSGLIGWHIAQCLQATGVPRQAIRIVDLNPPADGEISYFKADVTSQSSVDSAFARAWPAAVSGLPLTVFHTAAVIRPFERDGVFYPRCARVNVLGSAHVLAAARKAGASVLIFTSSSNAGASGVDWLYPLWVRRPRAMAQRIGEDDFWQPLRPARQFPSTYAVSKAEAERMICGADGAGMRTGAIRPGNGVYGDVKDHIISPMLVWRQVLTCAAPWVQNWANVRNVAQAHLLLEAALLGGQADQVAGRPFMITDGGPPLRFQDLYTLLSATSSTGFRVWQPTPVLMLLVAYGIEAYCRLLARAGPLRRLMGEPKGLVRYLQPGTMSSSVTSIIDDSLARKRVEEGGLGYRPACTSLEGLCAQVHDWNERVRAEPSTSPHAFFHAEVETDAERI